MKDAWWTDFFREEFESHFLDYSQKEVQNIVNFLWTRLSLKPGETVFDQCCGNGKISRELASRGVYTLGIDQCENYILKAKKEALEQKHSSEFLLEDAYYFVRPQQFNAGLSWHTSFGYSKSDSENKKMLQCAFDSLKTSGAFILDYYNSTHIENNFQREIIYEKNGSQVKKISQLNKESKMMETEWVFESSCNKTKRIQGQTRFYSAQDLKEMFLSVGFKSIELFGSIEGEAFSAESLRCIICGHK